MSYNIASALEDILHAMTGNVLKSGRKWGDIFEEIATAWVPANTIASAAEALAGSNNTKAVSPSRLKSVLTNVVIIGFAGAAAAGPCTATGLKAGDIILQVTGVTASHQGDQSSHFEAIVTVGDQIQQSHAANLSTFVYIALVLRQS